MMPPPLPCAAEPYLPHAAPMAWVDEILEYDGDSVRTRVRITPDTLLLDGGVVPVWAGLEYMAQTIGAFAGLQARENGEPVRIGFLLGTRRFEARVAAFELGQVLTVEAQRLLLDANGLGTFACRILVDGREAAQARLNVYQPDDPAAVLQESH